MTPLQARAQILATFKAAWDTTGLPCDYDDGGATPPANSAWARVTLRHATGGQSSLSGADGTKRWTQTGTVIAQVFAPIGDGKKKAYELAELVVNAYRDARGSVWYRNPHLKEAGRDGAFNQINVYVTFEYDETR